MKRLTDASLKLIPGLLGMLLPTAAFAHAGTGMGSGLGEGFIHPFGGPDHLLAMVAVGMWAAQLGGRAVWLIPAGFVGMMAAGGLLGMAGIDLPYVEHGIAASVLILGLLIAGSVRLAAQWGCLLVGACAVFHGYAHGVEMPVTAGAVAYGTGFILATIALHGLGIALASLGIT
ncbi:MAG: HupE/UreJ family protein, partial [Methylophilaceae bacterium]|nr:HupE/UreJ family protein [Methylophilaceae bacterium]